MPELSRAAGSGAEEERWSPPISCCFKNHHFLWKNLFLKPAHCAPVEIWSRFLWDKYFFEPLYDDYLIFFVQDNLAVPIMVNWIRGKKVYLKGCFISQEFIKQIFHVNMKSKPRSSDDIVETLLNFLITNDEDLRYLTSK